MNSLARFSSAPARLGAAEVAGLSGVDCICLARNGGLGCPSIAYLVGPPGIVRALDASTLVVPFRDEAPAVPLVRCDESGDRYAVLMTDSERQWALILWGAVRWIAAPDASADLCAALGIARRERPHVQLVIVDILAYDAAQLPAPRSND
jgi:hypothetical protein